MWALVHCGDPTIAPAIREWLAAHPGGGPRLFPSLEHLALLAEARQSPEALLGYIAEHGSYSEYIVCLLRLGAEWKVDAKAVRRALAGLEKRVTGRILGLTQKEKTVLSMRRGELGPVREEAIRLGYFTERDWPDARMEDDPLRHLLTP